LLKHKPIRVLGIVAILLIVVSLGLQIFMAASANRELRGDMQALAAQLKARSGLTAPSSDEDLHRDILEYAQRHGIDLTPDQVTVRRRGGPNLEEQEIYLAADYRSPIRLLGLKFTLHFTPEARHQFRPGDWRSASLTL
jgi:type II secretory pathway pseudopilin PulG